MRTTGAGYQAFLYREWALFIESRTNLWLTLVPPLATLLFFAFSMSRVAGSVQGVPYHIFLLPGIAIMSVIGNALSSASRTFTEGYAQVLAEYFSLPASRSSYVAAKLTGAVALATAQGLVFFIVGSWIFGFRIPLQNALLGLTGLFLTSASLAGLFLTLALLHKDMGGFLLTSNVLAQLLIWSAAIFYPVAAMPMVLRGVAQINPATYGVEILRDAFLRSRVSPIPPWLFLLAVSIVSGLAAWRLLIRRASRLV